MFCFSNFFAFVNIMESRASSLLSGDTFTQLKRLCNRVLCERTTLKCHNNIVFVCT